MEITRKTPRQFLTKTSGFLHGYQYTLNPYIGCSFECFYCYVRRLPVSLFRKKEWGSWVDIKEVNSMQFRKELQKAKKKGDVTIFMSSSTDPYQPIEVKEKITRKLLEEMVIEKPDFLFVQTRSPLVTRDIDLFQKLKGHVLVSITIETDREDIKKRFSPKAPPIKARIKVLEKLKEAGIPSQAAVAPVLPYTKDFPYMLKNVTNRVCIDDFFLGDGANGVRSKQLKVNTLFMENWFHPEMIQHVYHDFQKVFHQNEIFISQEGFLPLKRGDEA